MIVVFSDSHGKIHSMRAVLDRLCERGQVDAVIHLGDYTRDIEALSGLFKQTAFYSVPGNCDFSAEPLSRVIEAGGKRIFITHGHEFGVKAGLDMLKKAAAKNNADICLFGHTHEAYREVCNGMLIINPGSINYPRGRHGPSYAVISACPDGKIDGNVMEVSFSQTLYPKN